MRLKMLALAPLLLVAANCLAAEHVVVVVWDGMRPDLINNQNCPNLAALVRAGVTFAHNHPSYPSSTNVNGAVLATGDFPGHNGIFSNQEYRPAVDPLKQLDTSELPDRDPHLNVHYLNAPTVAEIVQQAGFRTAVAGSKPVAQLADRSRQRTSQAAKDSTVIYRGKILPVAMNAVVASVLGPFPKRRSALPNRGEDSWTTRALTEVLWKEEVPKFSLLWLSEPDLSQHETSPGSRTSLAAIKSDDENLARVLSALRAKKVLATTDVIVVSDHGFSTIDRAVDMMGLLRAAGFDATRSFVTPPKPGQVMVVSLGGSVEFYVIGHEPIIVRKLADFLQRSDFSGVILAREKLAGTFALADLHLATADAPDLIVSSRWREKPNQFGVAGEVATDVGKAVGQGTHSTFSPHDLHNTLVASGPDFRRGWQDESPTGNVDVAPTVLFLLRLSPKQPMDGRVLREALQQGSAAPIAHTTQLRAERPLGRAGTWRQTLSLTSIGGETYVDEGNGAVVSP